jgi:RNA polymerase sigma-32 factor
MLQLDYHNLSKKKRVFLSPEEEKKLFQAWEDHKDPMAFEKILLSYIGILPKILQPYKNWNFSQEDLVAEGIVGLIQALQRFDYKRENHFYAYAIHWINAAIQEYTFSMGSLVKIPKSNTQKRLFFKLKSVKKKISCENDTLSNLEILKKTSQTMQIPLEEVIQMDQRLRGDYSLDMPVSLDDDTSWGEYLVSEDDLGEDGMIYSLDQEKKYSQLRKAMEELLPKERAIIEKRFLTDNPATLKDLAFSFNKSLEHIRNVEHKALKKLKNLTKNQNKHRIQRIPKESYH